MPGCVWRRSPGWGCWPWPFPAGAQAQVKLEAKFPEGQTLRYRIRTSTHQVVYNLGMEMPSNRERTVVRSESIGKRRGDSSLPIAVKVDSLRERLRLPGGLDVTYDSKDKAARVANPDLDFFNGLFQVDGQVAYTVVLDGKNKVKAIEGADALRERVDRLDPRAGDLLRSRLAAETLKQEFEQSARGLAGRTGQTGRALGADRGRRRRRRAGAGPPQEVRVRRHREDGRTRRSTRSPPS